MKLIAFASDMMGKNKKTNSEHVDDNSWQLESLL
jgi:hypothetical protein